MKFFGLDGLSTTNIVIIVIFGGGSGVSGIVIAIYIVKKKKRESLSVSLPVCKGTLDYDYVLSCLSSGGVNCSVYDDEVMASSLMSMLGALHCTYCILKQNECQQMPFLVTVSRKLKEIACCSRGGCQTELTVL